MTEQMSLVVFARTGHVLGAVTRTANPEGKLEPPDLVDDGMQLRDPTTGEQLLIVEPDNLKVVSVIRREPVLMTPRRYVVVDDVPQPEPDLYDPIGGTPPVQFAAGKITLTLPAATSENLEAWVQVEGGPVPARILLELKIVLAVSNIATTDDLPLAPGDYGVLAMVPGYRPFTDEVTVT